MLWWITIMAGNPREREDLDGDLAVKRDRKTARARLYKVIFHNDDYTTKWFVVEVLRRFFHLSETAATSFMLIVHKQGEGVVGVYTKDIAESKVAQVHEFAREYEMPLRLSTEPEE
jgi:ATP-dependent Clp protease adaptor protein ClpS